MRIWNKICSKLTLQEDILIHKKWCYFFIARQNIQWKPRNLICKKWINWLRMALNETKYNRISFLVLLRLIFEKTTENKSEELKRHVKINLKTRNQIISSPFKGILLFNMAKEGWKLWIKKTKKTSQLFRDQSYLNCVISSHLFLFLFVL